MHEPRENIRMQPKGYLDIFKEQGILDFSTTRTQILDLLDT